MPSPALPDAPAASGDASAIAEIPGLALRGGFALRAGQAAFLGAWAEALRAGERNALGVFVPGYGKTITALASYLVARALGVADRLVVFVPRGNLRDQYADADELARVFHALGVDRAVSYCVADSDAVFLKNLDTEVVVTTYQYASGAKGNSALVRYCRAAKALFVFDEVHHLADGGTWAQAIARFPHAASVALSGTPMRADNKTLFGVPMTEGADGIAYYRALHEVTMREAHAEGGILKRVDAHVVDYTVRMVQTDTGETVELSLSDLRREAEATKDVDTYLARRKLRFHEVYLETLLGPAFARFAEKRGTLARLMARAGRYTGYPDHQMLVIAMSNAHAAAILAFVRQRYPSVTSARIGQDVPAAERAALLDAYRRGEIAVMVQVDMIGEGTDIKPISVLVKADLVRALGKTMQQVFRGMRHVPAWPDEANRCDLYAADDSDVVETLRWIAAEQQAGIKTRKTPLAETAAAPGAPPTPSAWELLGVREGARETHSLEQMPGYRAHASFHRDVPVTTATAPSARNVAAEERRLRLACAELAKEVGLALGMDVRTVHAEAKRRLAQAAPTPRFGTVAVRGQAALSVRELEAKRAWLERCLRDGRLA